MNCSGWNLASRGQLAGEIRVKAWHCVFLFPVSVVPVDCRRSNRTFYETYHVSIYIAWKTTDESQMVMTLAFFI